MFWSKYQETDPAVTIHRSPWRAKPLLDPRHTSPIYKDHILHKYQSFSGHHVLELLNIKAFFKEPPDALM